MATASAPRDYSLVGRDSEFAVARGLAAAEWYQDRLPRKHMKALMERSDGPAIRDTIIWLGRLHRLRGSAAMCSGAPGGRVPFFFCYGVLYGSSTDSRWHECGHGTAFKTRWMNDVVYQIACFMIMREPTIWRWSHTRHHTDTIIVGRDPGDRGNAPAGDAAASSATSSRSPSTSGARSSASCCTPPAASSAEEKTFVPEMRAAARSSCVARIWLAIYLAAIALALVAAARGCR